MKILHVITSLRMGGAEKLMVDLLPRLQDCGLEVDLLLFDGTDTPFRQAAERAGIKVHDLGKGGSVYSPLRFFKLLPYLRKYDVVHTHNTAPQLFAAIGSVLCSVVLCTTEHTTTNRRRDRWWYRSIDRWIYNRYHEVICISDKTEYNLRHYLGYCKADITTKYNGIDTGFFNTAEPSIGVLTKPEKCKNLIMVAGFRSQKDQKTVIRSISLLPETYHIYFVGDGPFRDECEILAKQLNVLERVHFLGIRTDVASLLRSSDVVILSSHWEGFGLAAVEGMAAGKPIIASNVDGLAQVVDGAGLLFPHEDAEALARAIETVCDDKNLYDELVRKGKERAKQYDINTMVQGYMDVYKNMKK